MRLIAFVLLMAVVPGFMLAQQAPERPVHNEVVLLDKESGKPISNAFVYDTRNKHSQMSDSTGLVSLAEFQSSDTLVIKHPAYENRVIPRATAHQAINLESKDIRLDEFTFVAFKTRERKGDVPYQVHSIQPLEIQSAQVQTSADLLQDRGNLQIQKSQQGGGSPIIRGFEANRVLLVVDGVRMNNAIYRSGHLQNVVTLDNNIMERVEVMFGPSSVIYGSDALGGVVHFFTRDPEFSMDEKAKIGLQAQSRFSTANAEKTFHTNFNVGGQKLAFLGSITYSDFGDLRMGSIRHKDYPDFGKVPFYADRINGQDSMIANTDPNVHRRTGYQQLDLLSKLSYKYSNTGQAGINVQYSTSSDINRFDRLNEYRDGRLRRAEWYYGPQDRLLIAGHVEETKSTKFYDRFRAQLAVQQIAETRHTRSFGSDFLTNREEDVSVYSLNLDLTKSPRESTKIHYGVEAVFNDVGSVANSEHINSGETTFASTRYPDGGSSMTSVAAYANVQQKIKSRWVLNAGIRYNAVALQANFEDTTIYQLPFDEISYQQGALTGSAGVIFRPTETWQLNAVASSGFRAPNVDDVGKIFDNDDRVIVPSADVRPEYVYNAEFSANKKLFKDRLQLNGTLYYNWLRDIIVREEATLNGQDSLNYEGEMLRIMVNANADQAYIYGYSIGFSAKINSEISCQSALNYTYGWNQTAGEPLPHIPPLYGRTAVTYSKSKFSATASSLYNGWKRIEDYSPTGVDNEEEATVDGTPAWYVLNLDGSYQVTEQLRVRLGIRNLLDHHYKPFASGISGPGRNILIAARVAI